MRYVAFISYSHVDRAAARWLHRKIESFRIPRALRVIADNGVAVEKLAPVFLDREELGSSSDLADSVRDALMRSEFLIVVCSPNAARSRWVNEEIREFKALGRGSRILCLIVSGEPDAELRNLPAEIECFPAAIRYEVVNGQVTQQRAVEPLAADIRVGADDKRDAVLKIVSGLLGAKLDDLRQREQARRVRRLVQIVAASTIGFVVMAGLAATAWLARNEAEAQRRVAERKSLTAQRTADFMVSMFKVSDPSEARGNSITAREILDRGARQIDQSLRDEPQVRAELSTTLGEVYTGLGLFAPAHDLLTKARAVPGQNVDASLREMLSFADLEFQKGRYDEADALLKQAQGLLDRNAGQDPGTQARIWLGRGNVAAVQERTEDALKDFDRALASAGRSDPLSELRAQAMEGAAMTHYYAGDMPSAQREYEKALAVRIATSGETHPRVSESLNALGSIAYMQGQSARAEEYFLRSLAIDRRVIGDKHPDLAVTMNNLGRLRVERRKFREAIAILDESVAISTAQRGETHDDLIFAFSNLALAHMGLGDYATAEALFDKGLRAAIINKHRLHAPILTDLANLECRTGRVEEGLRRLSEARPIMAEKYPDDPWRVAYVDNIRAGCLTLAQRYAEAEPLIIESTPIVLKKWPPNTLYGHDTVQRAALLYARTGKESKRNEYLRLAKER